MAQTVTMTTQVTSVPGETGIPRLAHAEDADAIQAAALAAHNGQLSLRVDLTPITDELELTTTVERISAGYAGRADDVVDGTNPLYQAVIRDWPRISRSLSDGGAVGGGARSSFGELDIVNERAKAPNARGDDDYAGRLDAWADAYSWDQRPAVLAAVARRRNADSIVTGPVVFLRGKTRQVSRVDAVSFSLEISDLVDRLDQPVQSVRLLGNTGLAGNEGGPDLKGEHPPICVGAPYNAPGLLVATQPYHRYLVHRDRIGTAIQGVPAAYVGMNPLSLSPSQFTVTVGESNYVEITDGLVEDKPVTFRVIGPTETGTTVPEAARYILSTIGPLDPDEIDSDNFSIFRALVPFPIGWRITGNETYAQVMNALTARWATWKASARTGKITLRLNTDPDLDFIDHQLPRRAIYDVQPLKTTPPAAAIATGYRKNWNQVGPEGIVANASGTEYGQWAQQPHYRIAEPLGDAIDTLDPSTGLPDDWVTPFIDTLDAEVVHRWLAATFSPRWRSYRVLADARALIYEPGDVVEFSWPRWAGLADPLPYRIQSVEVQSGGGAVVVELTVWRLVDNWAFAADEDEELVLFEDDDVLALTG